MQALKILQDHNVRPSMQRIAILEYLDSHRVHPTAEMVYEGLRKSMPTLSRTTVYTSLRALADSRVIQAIAMDGEDMRFDGNPGFHLHFRCSKCGGIEDLPCGKGLSDAVAHCCDYKVDLAQVLLYGTCPDCASRANC